MSEYILKWSEVRIHTTTEAIDAITNRLHEFGISGVVIVDLQDLKQKHEAKFGEIYELNPDHYPNDGVYVTFYLPPSEETEQKLAQITTSINELANYGIDLGVNQIEIRKISEKDWSTAWKKYYHTTHVTDRITITPMWEKYEQKSPYELVINLDPGMAFGTGTHPTTQLSIEALEKYMKLNDRVIDVGCGSGVLSIVSARLGAKHVLSLDLDDIAVKSTAINAQLNDVRDRLDIRKNDLLTGIHHKAEVIVSNILAEIIVHFSAKAYSHLVHDGIFITSGIIKEKQELVVQHLQKVGFSIVDINKQNDWVNIVAQKCK